MPKATRKPNAGNVAAPKPAIRARLRLTHGPDIAIGPGKADLLDHIRETGSIAAASRAMGISYKRAWMLVETMNHSFVTPLVTASRGGKSHGETRLTAAGTAVLANYRRLLGNVEKRPELRAIESLLAPPPAKGRLKAH